MKRRTFMRSAVAGIFGSWGLPQTALGKAKAAAGSLKTIGLQLYTVRKEMEKDVEGTLAKVASLGYQEVEFAGYFNRPPAQLKTLLRQNGLAAPSAHINLNALKNEWQKTLEVAQAMGHHYLILGYLMANERTSLDDYKSLVELLNRAGEDCQKVGIQLGYHNHDFEFETMQGQRPYDYLLQHADAKRVKMEMDLYWITKAGQAPEKYFARYPGRFELFHVKDMDNTPKQSFTEVGRGVIDFKKIFQQAKKAGVKHYFVEQDQTPASPFDSIKISYDYLSQLKF